MTTITTTIHRARDTVDHKVAGAVIEIVEPFPNTENVLSRELHMLNGRQLANTLIGVLPAGTLEALLIKLLDWRRSAMATPAEQNVPYPS